MQRLLVTGANGFSARYLVDHHLLLRDHVVATCRGESKLASQSEEQQNLTTITHCDLCDANSISQLFTEGSAYSGIYHLAALSSVAQAEKSFRKTFDDNVLATHQLFTKSFEHNPTTRHLFVSSSEVYGQPTTSEHIFTEESPLRPQNLYGVSKASAELAVQNLGYRHNVDFIIVRSFSHFGPGQRPDFAIASFSKQLAAMKLGLAEPILRTGNLDSRRDYTDVRDIVTGYSLAMEHGLPGESYNLCSEREHSLAEIVEQLRTIADVDMQIITDPARVRPSDVRHSRGSAAKAHDQLGWTPKFTLTDTLRDCFHYWLNVLDAKDN